LLSLAGSEAIRAARERRVVWSFGALSWERLSIEKKKERCDLTSKHVRNVLHQD
jgi:hypothetical protein